MRNPYIVSISLEQLIPFKTETITSFYMDLGKQVFTVEDNLEKSAFLVSLALLKVDQCT